MTVRRVVPNLTSRSPQLTADFYRRVLDLEVVMDLGWIVTSAEPNEVIDVEVSGLLEG